MIMIGRRVPARCAQAATRDYWGWSLNEPVLEIVGTLPSSVDRSCTKAMGVYRTSLPYVDIIGSHHPAPHTDKSKYTFGYELADYGVYTPELRKWGRYLLIARSDADDS